MDDQDVMPGLAVAGHSGQTWGNHGLLPCWPLTGFVSAWLVPMLAGVVASDVGIRPFGYITSMVVTIGLADPAPAIAAVARGDKKRCPGVLWPAAAEPGSLGARRVPRASQIAGLPRRPEGVTLP